MVERSTEMRVCLAAYGVRDTKGAAGVEARFRPGVQLDVLGAQVWARRPGGDARRAPPLNRHPRRSVAAYWGQQAPADKSRAHGSTLIVCAATPSNR